MYSLNKLERNVLITVDEVLFHAPTSHQLDPRMIEQSIIVAEERFIRPEIGYSMYESLIGAKNVVVTSGNIVSLQALMGAEPVLVEGNIVNAYELLSTDNKSLWKNHLWKLTSECVIASAFPEAFVQFTSEGAIHKSPPAGLMVTSGSVTPLSSSMKWTLDKKIQDRLAPLIQAMHNYLCRNKSLFAYYNSKDCLEGCDDSDTDRNDKWAGIALDLYTDDV